jgi:FkbH-like protein
MNTGSNPGKSATAPALKEASDLRQEIDELIASGDGIVTAGLLSQLWAQENTASTASFLVSRYEQLRPSLNLLRHRLAILRSFTVEPILPLLRAVSFCDGIDLTIHLSDFNAHVQEILDPESALYRFSPDTAVLAVQTRDVAPELWRDFADLSDSEVRGVSNRLISEFRSWVRAFRSYSRAHLIIHNLEEPYIPNRGILDGQVMVGQSAAIQQINGELRALAAEHTGVYILDYDGLVARHGRAHWHDERKWLTVRLPMAAQNLNHLAKTWLGFLHPLTGRICKALVVDLDNTLWGGVIGEDGMDGIKLGPDYPGAAFQDLQRALLDLHRRGILLAICSKNNPEDALEAIEKHSGMLLKPAHFAATRINWSDKPQNLRDIAKELNIGVDTLAFLDDNPVERQQVRSELPGVTVIDLPSDPFEFARIVRESPGFERLTLSQEDQQRGNLYQAQQEREQLQQSLTSKEDFYRSLHQEAEIAPLTKSTRARIAQLINKTNQFTLTTRRYTEQQIVEMLSSPGWYCFSIRVRDRFGDNGRVGAAITHCDGELYEIDTFLLSCRVIGRTVESAFLSFLLKHARDRGALRVQGWFLPTEKNAPAGDFYSKHGFSMAETSDAGTLWIFDLSRQSPPSPEWIKVQAVNGDNE